MESSDNPFVIYEYTRKQAIEDGVLVDITEIAKQYGFVIPVAITATLFDRYIRPTPELEEYGQSLEARLGDNFTALYFTERRETTPAGLSSVDFLMEPEKLETMRIIGDIGQGDEGEPVHHVAGR